MPPTTPLKGRTAANDAVHDAVQHVLRLHEAVERGERRDLAREQSALTSLLLAIPAGSSDAGDRGARYAVVCWIDEMFTTRSKWAEAWNERKLESELYGGNDRAWEFWRQAKLAEAQPTDDALRAYFLCVALGFRGRMRDEPAKLQAWVEKTRPRAARAPHPPGRTSPLPRRRQPARLLRGAARLRRMTAVAAVVVLCLLPLLTYSLVQRLLG
ncbi:hypothetical protein Mal64_04610 [Pseudobythopirellula maris]|uniref:Type IV / VI secretion system DotU domain-containing protein n=1 Tax=Pseudobythopirellula maris TaxID=2527991 RepID=A0A5C5ZSN4_9BACT|nr:DotU family type IV/VI secretion system protein [Pseudobythopirellula maris]TWT90078.1 hypothetical protein Mal64_04610 [Pseudobythopirellula maris]